VTFEAAIKTCFRKAFNASDRATRSEYWWVAAFCFVVSFVGFTLFFEFLPEPRPMGHGPGLVLLVFFGAILLLFIGTAAVLLFIALCNAGERRLNDASAPGVRVRKRRLSEHQRRLLSNFDARSIMHASGMAAVVILGLFPVLSAALAADADIVFPLKLLSPLFVLPAMFLTPLGWILTPAYVPFYFLAKRSYEHENEYGPNPNEVSP
jgi:uncharacterized membrane protein YhaH (DUF805 family)